MSESISFNMTWQGTLNAFLVVLENGTAEGRKNALEELQRMAWLADNAFKPLELMICPMKADPSDQESALADHWNEVAYWDVIVRIEGSDPIMEYENLSFEEARTKWAELKKQFPQAEISDLSELLR